MPDITKSVPRTTKYTFTRDDLHLGVWAIQRAFNLLYSERPDFPTLIEDGAFGPGTESAVKWWQQAVGLPIDGVFGPASQKRLVRSIERRVEGEVVFPIGLLASVIEGESGNYIAAVNWSVAGGVDCGYTQRRVYEQADGTMRQTDIEKAWDSPAQFRLAAQTFREKKDYYLTRAGVKNRADKIEYAWRLAVLNHNWPYGAQRLADGYTLSNKVADWVPQGTKFDDGAPVVTYAEWAQFYAMGAKSHNHYGRMVRYVQDWTA